jgi:DNA-binding transcriptional ArsR family regulator
MPTIKPIRTKKTSKARPPSGPARLVISEPGQLQALGDPTRWRILGILLDAPASVQELAAALGRAKGTVGHHVRVLHDAGLIRLAETRRVRGVTEKRYERVAPRFVLAPEKDADVPAGFHPRVIRNLPLQTAAAEASSSSRTGDPSMSIVVRARMSAERAARFARLLETLADEFVEGAPGRGETYGFVAGIYVPDWAVPVKGGR